MLDQNEIQSRTIGSSQDTGNKKADHINHNDDMSDISGNAFLEAPEESLLPHKQQSKASVLSGSDRKKSRSNSRNSVLQTATYVQATRYGYGGEEDEVRDPDILEKVADKTPGTKRRII